MRPAPRKAQLFGGAGLYGIGATTPRMPYVNDRPTGCPCVTGGHRLGLSGLWPALARAGPRQPPEIPLNGKNNGVVIPILGDTPRRDATRRVILVHPKTAGGESYPSC